MRRLLFAVLAFTVVVSARDAVADLFFKETPSLPFAVHLAYARLFFVRDVNGDGRSDLVDVFPAESLTNTTVTVYVADATGSLVSGHSRSFPGAGFERATVGHRNPDGSMDLMACSAFVVIAVVSIATPAYPGVSVSLPAGVQCTTPVPADFNADGYDDLAYTQSNGAVFVMLRKTDGGFTAPQQVLMSMPSGTLISGDFNGDGRADLALRTSSQIGVSFSQSNGSWTATGPNSVCGGRVIDDFDGDGADDLLCRDTANTMTRILRSAGDGTFNELTSVAAAGDGMYAVRDFDGDGHADLLAGDRIVLNDGTNHLGQVINAGLRTANVGDFDGDGRHDLLLLDSIVPGGNRYTLLLYPSLNRGWRPSIAAAGAIARTQGSPGAAATLATVSDVEDAAGALQVTLQYAPIGITVSNISNAAGTVTATITAACEASSGIIVLAVTDSDGVVATTAVPVTVAPNPPPQVGAYPSATGSNVTVTPDRPPSDSNGVLASCAATGPPGFSGTLTMDEQTGQVRISGVTVPGRYTITVTVIDNCGATAVTSFALDVPNDVPTVSPWLLILLAAALVALARLRLS